MNYEDMSDFEINAAAAKILFGGEMIDFECNPFPDNYAGFSYETQHGFCYFNGCNNPSDAWPIIVKNKIRISPVMHMSDDNGEYLCNGMWEAGTLWSDDGAFYNSKYNEASNENPLRAAMIVFLMMQDGAK